MSEIKENAMRNGRDGLDRQDGLDGRKEKFTPGPWNVVDQREMPDVENDYWIQGGNTIPAVVCRIENCHLDEEEANAYLIAAAPDMYFALKDMVLTVTDLLEAILYEEENTDCLIAVLQEEIDNAVKVLQKARGEKI